MNKINFLVIVLLSTHTQAQTYNETRGDRAGADITTGDYNVIVGDAAGRTMTNDSRNVIMGYRACVGTLDVADAGDGAADEITTDICDPNDSVMIGYHAGIETTAGDDNVFIGSQTGTINRQSDNTFIGAFSGQFNTTGLDNTFIGALAGQNNSEGNDNVFIGNYSGLANTTADFNTALGADSIQNNLLGGNNTVLGFSTGINLGKSSSDPVRNTFLGAAAGYEAQDGVGNTCLGANSCLALIYADFNTFVGVSSGADTNRIDVADPQYAQRNTGLGINSGIYNRSGSDNVWIGAFADSGNYYTQYDHESDVSYYRSATVNLFGANGRHIGGSRDVSRSVSFGAYAQGESNDTVAIGFLANSQNRLATTIGAFADVISGFSIAIGYNGYSNTIYQAAIGDSFSNFILTANADGIMSLGNSAYRFADVVTNQVSINAPENQAARIELAADSATAIDDIWSLSAFDGANFSIASLSTGTEVNVFSIDNSGNAMLAGDISLSSDRRLKQKIHNIENALALLSNIDGKTYHWKDNNEGDAKQYGLIAQEVEAIIPELVGENSDGYKTINYQGFVPILVSAMNETQQQTEQMDTNIESLEKRAQQQAKLLERLVKNLDSYQQ